MNFEPSINLLINKKCKLCEKSLVPIGRSRKNGRDYDDWFCREYHKKCWKAVMDFERLDIKITYKKI